MSCPEPRELIHAYLDRELDLAASLEIERHLAGCASCTREYESGKELRARIAAEAPRFAAPAKLRAALRPRAERRPMWWLAVALPAALAAMLAALIVPWPGRGAPPDLVDEAIADHVRSLMADHLTDVASTDKHTVKPWFEGKLDFAPAVVDLADHGFPLVGGRLEYLAKRPVAALVYGRQRHFINLFVRPADSGATTADPVLSRQGFHVVRWLADGMSYCAVSDLNPAELEEFAGRVRERAKP